MRRPPVLPYVILTFASFVDRLRFPIEKEATGEPKFLPVDVQTVAMTVDDSERYGRTLIPPNKHLRSEVLYPPPSSE